MWYQAELEERRKEKWRVAHDKSAPVRTLDDARAFVTDVGMTLMYPLRPPGLAPTFIGAVAGTTFDLPTRRDAYKDPRAGEATLLAVRLLREKAAFEVPFGEDSLLVSAAEFPYFYSLIGERNHKQAPNPGE